jgi:RHS repeat-associated protein
LGRLTARSTTGGSGCTNCALYSFTYNNAGNQLTKASTISGDAANGTTTFAYDPLSRVTGYTPPTVIAPQTYTWNGQPDRASIKTGTGTPVNVTFDAASRPVSDSAGGTYSSDKEGRITAIPGKTLVYDALGRLTQVKAAPSGTVLANYTYDALDRLRTINVGSATNRFRYVGQTDAVAQIVDGTGTVLSNHATDLDGTELYDFTPGGASQTYLGRNDHDDVTWTASTTGAVSARASYDPYGNLVSSSGTTPATRWQGSYYDGSSGLYYVNARWYGPALGTFLSDDPHIADVTDPQARDPYAYGSGDAIDASDPTGEWSAFTTALWARTYARIALANEVVSRGRDGSDYATDCTDFVSRALLAGRYRMVVPPELKSAVTSGKASTKVLARYADADKYWFMLRQSDGAHKWIMNTAWKTAPYLYSFFTTWKHGNVIVPGWSIGPSLRFALTGFRLNIYYKVPAGIKRGDIAFADWGDAGETGITHAMVVISVTPHNVYFAQHTPDETRDLLDLQLTHTAPRLTIVRPK